MEQSQGGQAVSNTPRTDAAYAASIGAGIYELFKVSQDIERELTAANERIKQLEQENDALRADLLLWDKAGIGFTTEDKP
jgi:hypothetical protein